MLPHSEIRTVYQSLYILVQPTPKARQWILMSLFSFSSLKCYWYLNSHWLEEQIWLSSCMYPGLLICISNVCVCVCEACYKRLMKNFASPSKLLFSYFPALTPSLTSTTLNFLLPLSWHFLCLECPLLYSLHYCLHYNIFISA